MDQVKNPVFCNGPIQKNRDPVLLIHMIRRHDAVILNDHIAEEHIIHFQIDHINRVVPRQTQLASLYAHDESKPFIIVSMAEYGVAVILLPWVFR